MASGGKHPRVGVGVILAQNNMVLVGKRKGGLEPDTWALPGGHLEMGETFEACAERELKEETGLEMANAHFVIACNTVFSEDAHYVTIFIRGTPVDDPTTARVTEPDKCHEWRWVPYNDIPQPRFTPLQKLLDTGFDPCTDFAAMHVRLSDLVVSDGQCTPVGGSISPMTSRTAQESEGVGVVELADAVMPSASSRRRPNSFSMPRSAAAEFMSDEGTGGGAAPAQPGVVSLAPPVYPSSMAERTTSSSDIALP